MEASKKFTTIDHNFRVENNLSLNEYVVCDTIFFLSSNTESKVPNWCYKSKQNFARDLGLSKQSIINIVNRMIAEGFVIKQEVTGFLRTTAKWHKVYLTEKTYNEIDEIENCAEVKKMDDIGKENLPDDSKKTLPHNNNIDNYNYNKKDISVSRPIYRKFKHLTLYQDEFEKLNAVYTVEQIDSILDDIENFKKNTNYTSLYLTAKKWLKTPQNMFNKNTITNGTEQPRTNRNR